MIGQSNDAMHRCKTVDSEEVSANGANTRGAKNRKDIPEM